jgi:hypothetical protein
MTRRHFEAFAEHIRKRRGKDGKLLDPAIRQEIANLVAEVAIRFNPRFNEERFLEACEPVRRADR